jgi:hypothetical protein
MFTLWIALNGRIGHLYPGNSPSFALGLVASTAVKVGAVVEWLIQGGDSKKFIRLLCSWRLLQKVQSEHPLGLSLQFEASWCDDSFPSNIDKYEKSIFLQLLRKIWHIDGRYFGCTVSNWDTTIGRHADCRCAFERADPSGSVRSRRRLLVASVLQSNIPHAKTGVNFAEICVLILVKAIA